MDAKTSRPISNREVAACLGMSVSGVSRIRTGSREPSPSKMLQILQSYGWSTDEQLRALATGKYASEFNRVLFEFSRERSATSA